MRLEKKASSTTKNICYFFRFIMNFAALFLSLLSVAEANIDARQPPILTQSAPQELPPFWPTAGLTIELPCVAVGIPEPEYLWKKDDAPFKINDATVVSRGEGGTIILDGTNEIGGRYQCTASNEWGKALSDNTYLPRADLKTLSIPLYEVVKKQGEGLRLPCSHLADSIPEPTYSWILVNDINTNEKKPLLETTRLVIGLTGGLYIKYLQPDDQQVGYTYKCQARNGQAGTTVEGSPAKITVIPDPVPDYVPKIISAKREYLALVGEDVSIDCVFESSPEEHNIYWNQLNVPPERAEKNKYETRFTIKVVETRDAGTYQCWASNAQGTSERINIVLTVESKPTFVPGGELQNLEVVQGQNAMFTCLNTGTPTPTVQWSVNGDDLDSQEPGPRRRYKDNGQSLVLTNVCKEAPQYCTIPDLFTVQCKVTNTHGYLYQGASLNVLLPTIVTVQPKNVLINDNTTTVILTCTAETDPILQLTYKWIHNGEQLNNDTNQVVSIWVDNSLHLDFTLADDDFKQRLLGDYKCVAESGQFSGNDGAYIETEAVQELPGPSGVVIAGIVAVIVLVVLAVIGVLFWRLRPRFIQRLQPATLSHTESYLEPIHHRLDEVYLEILEEGPGKPLSMDALIDFVETQKASAHGFREEFMDLYHQPLHQATESIDKVRRFKHLKEMYEKEAAVHIVEAYGDHRKHSLVLLGDQLRHNALWRLVWCSGAENIIAFGYGLKQRFFDDGPHDIGELEILINDMEVFSEYSVLNVMLTKEGGTRKIRVFLFFTWEEGTVPLNAASFVDFQRKLRQTESEAEAEIVLCSDRMGRSGTFIAIDYSVQQAAAEQKVDVFHIFTQLLSSCSGMKITKDQYGFAYEAIIEHWESRDTAVLATQFCGKQDDYVEHSRAMFKTIDHLRKLSLPDTRRYQGNGFPEANRNCNIIPVDVIRPQLQTDVDTMGDCVNAVYVNSYRHQNAFIATQTPMEETVRDFWRMIYDSRVRMIVMLNETSEDTTPYWPSASGATMSMGKVVIMHKEENVLEFGIITRLFVVKCEDEEELHVAQFQLTCWPDDDDIPYNCYTLLRILHLARISPFNTTAVPIVVHCRDGAQKTGLCCAAMFIIEQIQEQQIVDIFRAVRRVQASRPQFIISQDQIHFLHEFVKKFIESNQVYANM